MTGNCPRLDEAHEQQQRFGCGQCHVQAPGRGDRCAIDRFDLGAASGLNVLQHRWLVPLVLGNGAGDVGLALGWIHFDTEPLRDRQHFNDDLLCEPAAFRRRAELIDGAPGDGANAVERGIERDLLPDRSPYGGVRTALETGGRERLGDHADDRSGVAVSGHESDDTFAMRVHVARRDHVGRPGGHADQNALGGGEPADLLDIAQPVLQGQHMDIRANQVLDALERGAGVQRLGKDHQQLGWLASVFRSADLQRLHTPIAVVRDQSQAIRADGADVCIVDVDQRDSIAALSQQTAKHRAHGASADDSDPHDFPRNFSW